MKTHKTGTATNTEKGKSLSEETLLKIAHIQGVVFVSIYFEKVTEFNDYYHSYQLPIALIKADVRGLFGSLFCDFGPHFIVLDIKGEEPYSGIIASVSNANPGFVSFVDDERLDFEDESLVVFSKIEGRTKINNRKPRNINYVKPYSFLLEEDTTNYGEYITDGIVTQGKQPKVLNFKALRTSLKDPSDFFLSDFSQFDRPAFLHLAFQALDRFLSPTGRFLFAGSKEDAQKLVEIASEINESLGNARLEEVHPKLLPLLAFRSRAVLNPMAAMFGGVVGKEVAATKKPAATINNGFIKAKAKSSSKNDPFSDENIDYNMATGEKQKQDEWKKCWESFNVVWVDVYANNHCPVLDDNTHDLPLWQLYSGKLVQTEKGMFITQQGSEVAIKLLPVTVCRFVKEHEHVFFEPWELVASSRLSVVANTQSSEFKDRIFDEFNSLSVIYQKPSYMFTDKEHRGPFEFSDALGNIPFTPAASCEIVPAFRKQKLSKNWRFKFKLNTKRQHLLGHGIGQRAWGQAHFQKGGVLIGSISKEESLCG